MSRFGQTEKIIFTCAVIALIALSYFLYDDSLLFPKANNSRLNLIGNLSTSQNDVRRKNEDTFSWIPAAKKDSVFQNDSVFTGDNSVATIQLQDGTQIHLEPNSLITLNLKNGQMNLDLRYGNLMGEIASGSSLTIKSGSEEFELKSDTTSKEKSKIQFNKAHSGDVDLKLITGDLKYIDKKKKATQTLTKDSIVAVTKKGDLKKVQAPVLDLKTPDNMQVNRINPDDPVNFKWDGSGDVARYELELSPTEDFSSVIATKSTSMTEAQITDPLAPGNYFWRVKALTPSGQVGALSTPRKLSISNLQNPRIITPTQAAQLNLEMKPQGATPLATKTEIQWQSSPTLKKFTLQVAKDQDFKEVISESVSESTAALTPSLSSGSYWVRVLGETEDAKKSGWSEPVSFSLNLIAQKEQAPVRPERPVLITTEVQFKVPNSQDRTPASTEAPKLAWKPVQNTKNYIVQISKDVTFKNAQKYDVTQSQTLWSQYKPGKYFYRVYARGASGLVSEPSDVGSIDIALGNLTLNPLKPILTIGMEPVPKETAISWSEVPTAKVYLVELDKDKAFSQPQKFEFTSANSTLTLSQPGNYNVRVQALAEDRQPLTEFSNIQEVLYTLKIPLQAPHLLEPFNNASIFLQTEIEPFIWLEWKKVKGASVYRIEISDDPEFSKILISKSIQSNRFLIKEKVPMGKIYWRVRAESLDETEASEWTEKREFTLYHQKNETFIK